MELEITKEESPTLFLGHLENAKHGITEGEGSFSFWVAGTTRVSNAQRSIKILQEELVRTPDTLIEIVLWKEPSNKFDPFAVRIVVLGVAELQKIHGGFIGYVPGKISRLVSNHTDSINSGRVVKIKNYMTKSGELRRMIKVAFNYTPEIKGDMERLLESLADEIT